MVPPNCESDEELLECLATLLLETERTIASRITGYFENMVHDLSDSTLKKEKKLEHRSCSYRFQPFQPSSKLVEKVDQPNQPKTVFANKNIKP